MRSEFLGECARFDGLAEAFNRTQYLVPRMSREALLRAIRRPAELYGGSVTQDLAENLISDVRGREDELPLIQNGLMLMWHRASAKAGKEPVALGRENFEHTGGLAKMLSDHADSIADKATPFTGQTDAVERLFRSLTDINTEGRAIRRPQSFGRLVALCGIPAKDLNSIIDLFRADGVSFLTPYFPAKIDERTIIDISHEALIRWWNRVAEPQDGWLKREFDDGLIWRSLKVEAEEFQGNRRHLLSAAATRQRREWLANRSALWSERYGGGWEAVGDLIQTSRRAAVRRWRWIWLLALPALLTIFIVDLIVVQEAFDPPEALLGLLVGLASIPVVGLMVVFAAWLLVSYVRQFLAWLRRRPAAGTSGQHGGGRVARDRRRAGRRSPIRSWGPRLLLLLSVVLVIYFAASATIGGALGVSDEVLILLLRAVTLIVVVLSVILFVLLLFSYIRQFFGWLRRRMRRSRANSRQRAGAQTPAQ